MAAERTFLAWMRSSLGLLAGGLAIIHLVPGFSTGWVRTALGLALILLAAAAAIAGLRRWLQVDRALRDGTSMPSPRDLWVFAAVLVVVTGAAAVATIVTAIP
nr:DUF202 domain-containing protein [Rhodococcus sp. HNM0569]